mmetsp:Transcript_39058/g.84979  ORF Transcript_39058/g.84979 Transcript_39058/m.84979 type:complete len:172 (-) Transcript_39058:172-687(-)|eukprot:CAMPEP_0118932044 /NCGR_PEP_ID=MMETSP1169-20130426/8958_1 /TAXON_ID=36882 /ORGANISM="Pyramimonas obovata, Strain CCMP722" /LENGTH=171 /DNA_ID=CAMNT_0006874637 /DNA_START=39 /DNA_END=554 /DNA_ORIENTATION=-
MAGRNITKMIPLYRNAVRMPYQAMGSSFRASHTEALSETGGTMAGVGAKVQIFSPSRVASQQGSCNTGFYKLQFEMSPKWENPLMGWTSSADPYSSMADAASGMTFKTKESAMEFCKNNGWVVTQVREAKKMNLDHPATIKGKAKGIPKAYSDNFSHKRRGIPTHPAQTPK